jgi:alkylation response protein AidB-like acyl-CoA dehydrogenase
MNMNFTDEQKIIQETARKIAQQELAPKAAEVDRDQAFPVDGLQQLAKAGFLGMVVPEALGGGGTDTLSFVLGVEAIAQGCASTALLFLTHNVVSRALAAAGSDDQKSRFLPALIRGERLGAVAATEPDAGSNTLAIATKAKAEGDDFVVNGTKAFITAAEEAEVYLVVLRTGQAKTPVDLSALIIEKGTPGFSFGKKDEGMGLRGISWGELVFEDCRVPKVNLLGAENGYLGVAMSFAGLAMVGAAATSLGIAQGSVEATIAHAKTRVIADQPIGNYQGIQFLVAEMNTILAAARALTYSAARQLDRPQPASPIPLYMAKLYATETAIEVTHKALQVHGGSGYSRELPLERYYRDARGLTLHFTPSEMLKGMMGKMLMGMPPI